MPEFGFMVTRLFYSLDFSLIKSPIFSLEKNLGLVKSLGFGLVQILGVWPNNVV